MLNALTIAVEVVGVVVVLVLLGLVIRVLLLSLAASPTLERARPTIETVRRNLRLLLVLVGVLGCLAIGGINGYWWHVEDRNLVEHTLGLLQSIPSTFWIDLAIAAAKVLGVCVLATIALRLLRRLLHNLCAGLVGARVVGLTAGASAPSRPVETVIARPGRAGTGGRTRDHPRDHPLHAARRREAIMTSTSASARTTHLLRRIASPADLRGLSASALSGLAEELRGFLIEKVSRVGGHVGSNLGAVALTIAAHRAR